MIWYHKIWLTAFFQSDRNPTLANWIWASDVAIMWTNNPENGQNNRIWCVHLILFMVRCKMRNHKDTQRQFIPETISSASESSDDPVKTVSANCWDTSRPSSEHTDTLLVSGWAAAPPLSARNTGICYLLTSYDLTICWTFTAQEWLAIWLDGFFLPYFKHETITFICGWVNSSAVSIVQLVVHETGECSLGMRGGYADLHKLLGGTGVIEHTA